ncbi:MAG TPA: ATP-grasp domain-containing protein [Acidimicrobiales bacterium]
MPRVVLVLPTATYRATDFVLAAESLGVEVVVASEAAPPLAQSVVVDLDDAAAAAALLERFDDGRPIDAVVAVDDRGAVLAATAAEQLGLPGNPPDAVAATRNKVVMRGLLSSAEVAQPRFEVLERDDDVAAVAASVGFPVVIKPTGLAGSVGVIRADDPVAAIAAAERAWALWDGPLLVERFVGGPEVAVEGLLRDGRLEVLAIFDKPDAPDGPFFEETIYVTPSRHPRRVLDEVASLVSRACAAVGLVEGPVHAEARLAATGPVLLEVAARSIGGLCARTLRFGAGISLEELILRHALGLRTDGMVREGSAAGVMMLPIPRSGVLREVRGQAEARAVPGVSGLELTIRPGRPVLALPEGDRYLGFLFARGATPDEVEASLRAAHAVLEIDIEDVPVEKGVEP